MFLNKIIRTMLLTFQERLWIPWRSGALQVPQDALVPIFAVPLAIGIAAINVYTCCIVFASALLIVGYGLSHAKRKSLRSKFFFVWLVWSLVLIVLVFESKMPLLELLPEENLILALLSLFAIFFIWRTKHLAHLNHVKQSLVTEDELPEISEVSAAEEEAAQISLLIESDQYDTDICSSCRKCVSPRTSHCAVCGACIKVRDHHSYWLNCCIGQFNHRNYVLCIFLSSLALLIGWNLTLTAVCHPFLVMRVLSVPVMLPDDCSEVFDDYELSLCFVVATYSLLISAYLLVVLLRQIYQISVGATSDEQKRGQIGNRKSVWSNWRTFLF